MSWLWGRFPSDRGMVLINRAASVAAVLARVVAVAFSFAVAALFLVALVSVDGSVKIADCHNSIDVDFGDRYRLSAEDSASLRANNLNMVRTLSI